MFLLLLCLQGRKGTVTERLYFKQSCIKTGDSLDIVESSTLPLTEKLMYKVEHEKDKIVVRRDGRNLIIPVENILFASSIPLDVIHEDFNDEI